jgi:ATP-dependent Clp protease ATP-binding subunit ClpA
MARVIQDRIKRPLADELLFGKLVGGGRVLIDAVDGSLQLSTEAEAQPVAPAEA